MLGSEAVDERVSRAVSVVRAILEDGKRVVAISKVNYSAFRQIPEDDATFWKRLDTRCASFRLSSYVKDSTLLSELDMSELRTLLSDVDTAIRVDCAGASSEMFYCSFLRRMRRELSVIAARDPVDALVLEYEAACRQVHEDLCPIVPVFVRWPTAHISQLEGLGVKLLRAQLSAWHYDVVAADAYLIRYALERVEASKTRAEITQIQAILRVNGEIVAKRRGGG